MMLLEGLLVVLMAAQVALEPPAELPSTGRLEHQGLVLTAGIEPALATVGDVMVLEIVVEAPAETVLAEPYAPDGFEPFVLRERRAHVGLVRRGEGSRRWCRTMV